VTYQSASIAMLPNFVGVSAPVPPEGPRRLYFAEPFHGKVQRASLALQNMLVMTSTADDSPGDFSGMVALARELQQRLFVPATLSAAKTVNPSEQGYKLTPKKRRPSCGQPGTQPTAARPAVRTSSLHFARWMRHYNVDRTRRRVVGKRHGRLMCNWRNSRALDSSAADTQHCVPQWLA
ncbi:MAG: hypothetical protein ACR2JY_09145, partial [Chloroflexota bacterium]